jgi:hypothetical protein
MPIIFILLNVYYEVLFLTSDAKEERLIFFLKLFENLTYV